MITLTPPGRAADSGSEGGSHQVRDIQDAAGQPAGAPHRAKPRLQPGEKFDLDAFGRFAGLLSHGVALLEADGAILHANERAAALLGSRAVDVVGKRLGADWKLLGLDGRELDLTAAGLSPAGAASARAGRVLGLQRAGGETVWLDSNVHLVDGTAGALLVWSLGDMTRWKQGRDALEASEARLASILENLPAGVVLYDTRGRTVLANSAARPFISGPSPSRAEGPRSVLAAVEATDEAGNTMRLADHPAVRAFQSRRPVTNVVMGVTDRRTGQRRWLLVNAHPQLDAAGQPTGVLTTAVDITRRKRAEAQAELQLKHLQAIHALSTAASRSTTIDQACRAAFRALGETVKPNAAAVLLARGGARRQLACSHTAPEVRAAFRRLAGWLHRQSAAGAVLVLAEGSDPAVPDALRQAGIERLGLAPLEGSDGYIGTLVVGWGVPPAEAPDAMGILGTVAAHLAIAVEQQRATAELRASEAKYRTLFEDALEGIYRTTPGGRILAANPALVEMLGFESEAELLAQTVPALFADPAERPAAAARLESAGKVRAHELVLRRKDGRLITVLENGRAVRDRHGRTRFYEGTLEDVTELKQAQDLFQTVANSSPAGIFILQDGRFQFLNDRFTEITGRPRAELIGGPGMDLVIPDDRQAVRAAAVAMLRGERSQPYEYRTVRPGGETIWVMETLRSVTFRGWRAVLGNFIDITERKRMERELERQAHFDWLTGLPNRKHFMEQLGGLLARPGPAARVAVLFLDLDGFKAINDAHGHTGGDEALSAVARRLQNCLRNTDLAARMGGDEFTVLLHGPDVEPQAERIAGRILKAFAQPFHISVGTARVSASIGIAYGEAGRSEAGEILRQADVALYSAKAAGKGRYCVHGQQLAA
jgi:diguanylate cyclase (GGDEF)-like protein/PAS domain S-box-containing protein